MPVVTETNTPSEAHLTVLRALHRDPTLSQRELAQELGISLGKTNYCLKALVASGWVKAKNFTNSKNKVAYRYLLTPQGIDQKTKLAARFLARKRDEYEALKREIEQLDREVQDAGQ